MPELVLVRHGESIWNQENRFTGWVDVDLSEKGKLEAKRAGQILKKEKFEFDVVFTSVLKRAVRTLWLMQEEMDAMYLPVYTSWRLNERHYGALQGLDKAETAAKYGEEQVKIWRRSYDTPPPPMSDEAFNKQGWDPRFQTVSAKEFPKGETLKTTKDRLLPLWNNALVPMMEDGERVLIVAHGNSIRAMVQHIENLKPEQIMDINIPTATPLVYELNDNLKYKSKRYLGDADEIAKAQAAVASQGKAKK